MKTKSKKRPTAQQEISARDEQIDELRKSLHEEKLRCSRACQDIVEAHKELSVVRRELSTYKRLADERLVELNREYATPRSLWRTLRDWWAS